MSHPSSSSPPAGGLSVVKGHGTGNDFVLVPDLDGALDLSADLVRAMCDRRSGIGADGVLRVVRSSAFAPTHAPAAGGSPAADTEFFMDYRNSDGSVAEMCGNGLRVFVRYLLERKLIGNGPVEIGTRGGARAAWTEPDGQITVDLGLPVWPATTPAVTAAGWSSARLATAVGMPNPHVVVAVSGAVELAALDLTVAPAVDPARPGGQNVEFVHVVGPGHLAMRVHERGVGETRSCGTGVAAAALVAMRRRTEGHLGAGPLGPDAPEPATAGTWRVDVPGGTCLIRVTRDGSVLLTGPAVLVARVEIEPAWVAAAGADGSSP